MSENELESASFPQTACPHPPAALRRAFGGARFGDAEHPDAWGQLIQIQAACGLCEEPLTWDVPRVGVMSHDATTDATGYSLNAPLKMGNQEGLADVLVNSVRDAPPQEQTTKRLRLAINDPGKFTPRVSGESLTSWIARAVVVSLPGLTWDGE